MSEVEGAVLLPDLGEDIDNETFGQVCDMDEDDDRSFSLGIVTELFEQVDETLGKMDEALADDDLKELSDLGHFLKGSSATLGLVKVKESCEKIQRYGKMEDLDGTPLPDRELCVDRITEALKRVKGECKRVERILKEFYGIEMDDDDVPEEEDDENEERDERDERDAKDVKDQKDKKDKKDKKDTAISKTEEEDDNTVAKDAKPQNGA